MIKSAIIAAGVWLGSFVADFLLWLTAVLLFSLPPVLSQALSYLISAMNRYILLRKIKYTQPRQKNEKMRFFRFLTLSVAVTLLSAGGMILLCFGLSLPAAYAKIAVTAATVFVNGKINTLIFRKVQK